MPAKSVVVTPLVPSGVGGPAIQQWVVAARRRLPSRRGLVSVVFVPPATSRGLNRQYRRRDRPTNILSFAYDHRGQPTETIWGELILCPSVIRREAREQRRPYRSYLRFLLEHGLIHLLGHDHQTPAEQRRWQRYEQQLSHA